jgi:hypothetical protein
MNHTHTAQQGHRYTLGERSVIAMQSGPVIQVREINQDEPYPLGRAYTVKASWLKPEPMVYFHGQVPA